MNSKQPESTAAHLRPPRGVVCVAVFPTAKEFKKKKMQCNLKSSS